MKTKAKFVGIVVSLIFVFSSHAQQNDTPVLKGPYLGQKSPGMTPVVFAAGVVSPDGSYIVFSNRQRDGFGGTDLYVIFKKSDKSWSTPINLGKYINSEYAESSPTISLDGQFLFFSRKGDIWWISSQVIDNIKAHK